MARHRYELALERISKALAIPMQPVCIPGMHPAERALHKVSAATAQPESSSAARKQP